MWIGVFRVGRCWAMWRIEGGLGRVFQEGTGWLCLTGRRRSSGSLRCGLCISTAGNGWWIRLGAWSIELELLWSVFVKVRNLRRRNHPIGKALAQQEHSSSYYLHSP